MEPKIFIGRMPFKMFLRLISVGIPGLFLVLFMNYSKGLPWNILVISFFGTILFVPAVCYPLIRRSKHTLCILNSAISISTLFYRKKIDWEEIQRVKFNSNFFNRDGLLLIGDTQKLFVNLELYPQREEILHLLHQFISADRFEDK